MGFNLEPLKTTTINGAELNYIEKGSGSTVIFVHGAISDLRTWENQLDPLSENFRVITYSRRYARPNKDIDPDVGDPWDTHVEDLAELIRRTESAPANLIGNSQGGYICILTAIKYPELVGSLCLEEPPVVPLFTGSPATMKQVTMNILRHPVDTYHVMKFGLLTVPNVNKAFQAGNTKKALEIFGRAVLGDDWFKSLSEERYKQIEANHSTIKAFFSKNDFPPLDLKKLQGLEMPTLLLKGVDSPAFLIALTRKLEVVLPNTTVVSVKNASHLMHEDNPAEVNKVFGEFIASLK